MQLGEGILPEVPSRNVWEEEIRIEYHSKSDRLGRCSFSLIWLSDYHPGHPESEYRRAECAQVFFADPWKHGFPRPEDGNKPLFREEDNAD